MSAAPACVTLFTDASSDHRMGIASWSAWAKYRADTPTMRRSGRISSPVTADLLDMNFNEAYAIVQGIREAQALYSAPAGTLIVIQTDNSGTAMMLQGGGKPGFRKRYERSISLYAEAIASTRLKPVIRLVQGHKGTVTPRNAVNTWCDKECRTLLKRIRSEMLSAVVAPAEEAGAPAPA